MTLFARAANGARRRRRPRPLHGYQVLLALIPAGITVLAYNAAVQATLADAETVHVASDLHRADPLTALRAELPTQDTERALNEQWCDPWRQGIPLPATLETQTTRNPKGRTSGKGYQLMQTSAYRRPSR